MRRASRRNWISHPKGGSGSLRMRGGRREATDHSNRWSWIHLKAEPTAQARWLRFFLTEDAFYLLVGKVLRLKGLGGEAGYQLKAEAARSE